MEGSVSSSASQPPGPSPWKIAASHKKQMRQGAGSRGAEEEVFNTQHSKLSTQHLALSKYVPSLENLCKATPVVKTAQTGTLRDSQRRTHSDFATAIINLTRLTQSANEATAGIAAIPTSRI